MTDTDTTFLVVKVPAEDYYERTGSFVAAVSLAAEYDAKRTGGGTCLLTGMSDIDFEVPTVKVAALALALKAIGLPCRYDDADGGL